MGMVLHMVIVKHHMRNTDTAGIYERISPIHIIILEKWSVNKIMSSNHPIVPKPAK
jgi:hypothetical protein